MFWRQLETTMFFRKSPGKLLLYLEPIFFNTGLLPNTVLLHRGWDISWVSIPCRAIAGSLGLSLDTRRRWNHDARPMRDKGDVLDGKAHPVAGTLKCILHFFHYICMISVYEYIHIQHRFIEIHIEYMLEAFCRLITGSSYFSSIVFYMTLEPRSNVTTCCSSRRTIQRETKAFDSHRMIVEDYSQHLLLPVECKND